MTDNWWTRPEDEMPPTGVVVDVISPGGMPARLKWQGSLWYLEDGTGYVYWMPAYWRRVK